MGKVASVSVPPTHWLCHVSSGPLEMKCCFHWSSDCDNSSKASPSSSSQGTEGLPEEGFWTKLTAVRYVMKKK